MLLIVVLYVVVLVALVVLCIVCVIVLLTICISLFVFRTTMSLLALSCYHVCWRW